MIKLKSFLQNRNAIFLLALTLGLTIPYATPVTRHLLLPVLALAMTLSTLEIGSDVFRRPRALLFPALLGIIMSYIILGNLIIGLSALLIRDEQIWTGFVLLAAAPPAIAVIPFSVFLHGDRPLSLIGTVGAYLGALAIMPLIAVGLLNAATFDPFKLVMITLELIVLPLAVSRLLIRKGWKERLDPHRGLITNWCFFVALYTLIGVNRNLIVGETSTLLPVVFIALLSMFLLGFLIDWIASLLHLPKETRTSLVLLGTLKNQGVSGGLAITLFTQEAALPSAISTIVMIGFVIWLEFKKRWE
jgi:BASS family bile acid:Na+ symporter